MRKPWRLAGRRRSNAQTATESNLTGALGRHKRETDRQLSDSVSICLGLELTFTNFENEPPFFTNPSATLASRSRSVMEQPRGSSPVSLLRNVRNVREAP